MGNHSVSWGFESKIYKMSMLYLGVRKGYFQDVNAIPQPCNAWRVILLDFVQILFVISWED